MDRSGERAAGLVLAAGASKRMGLAKQLLPVNGGTLLGSVLDQVLKSDLDRVILILGHRAGEIRKALGNVVFNPKLKIVENEGFRQGISSSILAGLSQVEEDYPHVMILLADIPRISFGLINLLLRRYLDSGLPLGAVKIKERRSHPVIFSRRLYHELHRLRGDVGARDLFRKYEDRICLVEPEDPYDPADMDTPSDYLEYRGSFENG